jgi:hypothetical protein
MFSLHGTKQRLSRKAVLQCMLSPRLGMLQLATLSVSKYLQQSQEQHVSLVP